VTAQAIPAEVAALLNLLKRREFITDSRRVN